MCLKIEMLADKRHKTVFESGHVLIQVLVHWIHTLIYEKRFLKLPSKYNLKSTLIALALTLFFVIICKLEHEINDQKMLNFLLVYRGKFGDVNGAIMLHKSDLSLHVAPYNWALLTGLFFRT